MTFFIGLVLIVLPAGRCAAQEPAATFRAGVSLVKVDAQVVDRGGRPIAGLTAADFTVLDEGSARKVVYFSRESEVLDIVLLLDVSGSMKRAVEELAGTARAALQPLGPDDRVGVILFARAAQVREELTGDRAAVEDEIRRAVREQSLGSGTVIYANIIVAAQYLARQPARGRRAVLIVTDNQSLNYQVSEDDVIREMYASDAVLNAILIGRQRRPDPPRPGAYVNPDFTPSDVFRLAEQTGGEAVESRQAGKSFREMMERIRSRYSLHYEAPEGARGLRKIRVELTADAKRRHAGATVRARAGYYAAAE